MNKFLMLVALAIAPTLALAHGGVEKSVGQTTVFLTQDPLSPTVGQEVTLTFVVADKADALRRHLGLPMSLRVIRTAFDDPAQDTVIHEQAVQTDANGSVTFRYAFDQAGYFDVELDFIGPGTSQAQTVGFLVQAIPASGADRYWYLLAGLVLGFGLHLLSKVWAEN